MEKSRTVDEIICFLVGGGDVDGVVFDDGVGNLLLVPLRLVMDKDCDALIEEDCSCGFHPLELGKGNFGLTILVGLDFFGGGTIRIPAA